MGAGGQVFLDPRTHARSHKLLAEAPLVLAEQLEEVSPHAGIEYEVDVPAVLKRR